MSGYGTDNDFTTWMANNGYTDTLALSASVYRQRGSDYLDALYANDFVGKRTGGVTQERQWPRTNAFVFGGDAIPIDVIPLDIIFSSYEGALQEIRDPGSLSRFGSAGDQVRLERVEGAVTVEYKTASESGFKDSISPILSIIAGRVKPYLIDQTIQRVSIMSIGGNRCA